MMPCGKLLPVYRSKITDASFPPVYRLFYGKQDVFRRQTGSKLMQEGCEIRW